VTGPVSMYQKRMRVGDMTRCGGWLCSMYAASGGRVVSHNLGGWDRKEGSRITPGVVTDHFHSWLRCLVGPGRGQGVNIADMEEDKALLLCMGHIEVEEEEELFPEDDDAEFVAIVEEFETGFDDDALLLAV
jgi:hypothetical protein